MRFIQILLFIIVLTLYSHTNAFSQKNKAFILRFEHQCSDPVAYPNYFDNSVWSDKLIKITSNWLEANFDVDKVDYKRKGTISYVPVVDHFVDLKERSLQFTAYDLSMTITSRLETGESLKKLRDNEALLSFEIKVWNKQERNIFRHRSKSRVVIIPNKRAISQAKISAADFQEFYEDGLRVALKQQQKARIFSFKQPQNITLEAFIKRASLGEVKVVDRINYALKVENDTVLETKNQLQNQYRDKNDYTRNCSVYNPITKKNYLFKALLKGEFPNMVIINLYEEEEFFGRIQFIDTQNQTLMTGKINEYKVSFEVDKKTLFQKFEVNGNLKSISQKKQDDNKFQIFFDKNINENSKTLFFHIITIKSLGEAMRKFYIIENKK